MFFVYNKKSEENKSHVKSALIMLENVKMKRGYSWSLYIKSPFTKKIKLMTATHSNDFTYVNNIYQMHIRNPLENNIIPRVYFYKHIVPQNK